MLRVCVASIEGDGCSVLVKEGHILQLMHALYGTKQAGRSWYQQLKDYMINELK